MPLTIDEVLGMLENVKKTANGWSARCPSHTDNSKDSLSIKMGDDGKILLYCFGPCEMDEVIGALGIDAQQLFPDKPKSPGSRAKTYDEIEKTYDYTDLAGNMIYQVVRYRVPPGAPKKFLQRHKDEKGKWIWNITGITPTLYGLSKLLDAVKENRSVCIVGGEKDVENLAKIGVTATTNSGGEGKNKWRKDFTQYFAGAKVVIIEDNDDTGRKHTATVGKYLSKVAADISVIRFPDAKEHYDISDWIAEGNGQKELVALTLAAPAWEVEATPDEPDEPRITNHPDPESQPFRFLGVNNGCHYYLPGEDLQITKMTADQHTESALINLAPLTWYEVNYPKESTGVDWKSVRNWMFRTSKKQKFNPRRIRGCGAWYDDGRVVQHLGDRLSVDGCPQPINDFDTKYIYNASYPIETLNLPPLNAEESFKFLELCRMLTWEKQISGSLLAGWCVIAPVCGILQWRPHIHITGSSDTGKSFTMTYIVKRMAGDFAMHVQSNTTEAGIRQALGSNAYPVIFDEIEGETKTARRRVQEILELMRQASSETGAPIMKGSTSGHAVEYMVRSCFALSSIGVNITQKADASRVSVLSLVKPPDKKKFDVIFKDIERKMEETTTIEWCAALRSRTLSLVPVILENAKTFGRVVAKKFDTNRIGDQYGALLAGAYSLSSDQLISEEDAFAWVEEQDWGEQSSVDGASDEERCLSMILEYKMSYSSGAGREECTIGEAFYNYNHNNGDMSATRREALERIGVKLRFKDRHEVIISNTHDGIRKALNDSQWEKNWGRTLKRIEGSETIKSYRFFGRHSRATMLPMDVIMGDGEGEDDA